MKDIKEKPTAHMPRSNATGEIPKAALKKAWAEAKEKSRTMLRESTSTQGDGDYTTAQDTSSVVTDTTPDVPQCIPVQGRRFPLFPVPDVPSFHPCGSR